jgi:putative FmdB family regulatory protein
MPIYEYACASCGGKTSMMRRLSERADAAACEHCGSEETSLAFSVPGKVGVGADAPAMSCGRGVGCGCAKPD